MNFCCSRITLIKLLEIDSKHIFYWMKSMLGTVVCYQSCFAEYAWKIHMHTKLGPHLAMQISHVVSRGNFLQQSITRKPNKKVLLLSRRVSSVVVFEMVKLWGNSWLLAIYYFSPSAKLCKQKITQPLYVTCRLLHQIALQTSSNAALPIILIQLSACLIAQVSYILFSSIFNHQHELQEFSEEKVLQSDHNWRRFSRFISCQPLGRKWCIWHLRGGG